MVKHLTTVILGGILYSVVLVGNAEACHKRNCRHTCPPTPVCVTKATYCPPAPPCQPKVKCCKIRICLPKFCHKQKCAPVVVACATPAPVGYSYPVASPQTSAQH